MLFKTNFVCLIAIFNTRITTACPKAPVKPLKFDFKTNKFEIALSKLPGKKKH